MSFLPARPRSANYTFVKPRDGNMTESGIYAQRYSAAGYMKGSLTFPLQQDTRTLFAALQAADRPGSTGFFFADLEVPYRDGDDADAWDDLPDAQWHAAMPATTVEVLAGTPGSLPQAGAVISIRSSNIALANFVTARVVVSVSGTSIELNHPLPYEFLSLTNNLQYCYNRPFVRAVFRDDTAQWSMDYNNFARVSTVNWMEDMGATINALKGAANLPFPPGGASGASGSERLLESGSARLLEDGGKRLLET